MRDYYVSKFFDILSIASKAMISLRHHPTKLDYLLIGTEIVVNAFNRSGVSVYAYFDSWEFFGADSLGKMLFTTLQSHPKAKLVRQYGSDKAMVLPLDGGRLGWICGGDEFRDGLYFSGVKQEDLVAKIRKACWEVIGSNNAVIVTGAAILGQQPKFIADHADISNCIETSFASEIAGHIRHFNKLKIPRSLLFVGPSGTGKSIITRQIAGILSAKTLRIPINELGEMGINFIIGAIMLLKPNILILDDLDRVPNLVKLFDGLEQYRNNTGILLATMNNVKKCDPALRRPGRFDKIINIEHMDDKVVQHYVPVSDENYSVISQWPIAYIREYCNIRDVLGQMEASKSVLELDARQKEARDSCAPDSENS